MDGTQAPWEQVRLHFPFGVVVVWKNCGCNLVWCGCGRKSCSVVSRLVVGVVGMVVVVYVHGVGEVLWEPDVNRHKISGCGVVVVVL